MNEYVIPRSTLVKAEVKRLADIEFDKLLFKSMSQTIGMKIETDNQYRLALLGASIEVVEKNEIDWKDLQQVT